MGNTDDDYLRGADEYRKNNPDLTDNDIKTYNINKLKYFKTTIAICAIYGSFALLMLLIVLFSPSGSSFITENFRTFTLTFVAGLIVIVCVLSYLVTNFKPRMLEAPPYDGNMCPDFWHAELNTSTTADDPNRYVKQLQCVPDNLKNVMKTTASIGTDRNANVYKYFNKEKGLASDSITGIDTIDCTKVYPNYLLNASLKDTNNNKMKLPNLYSCEYATQCGIPWTSMCPNGV